MDRTEIEVGRGLRAAASEVATAWKAAEAGSTVAATDRIYVADWATLHAVLSPMRLDLLKHLGATQRAGVQDLARALGRDEGRVHADMEALVAFGLIEREADGARSSGIDEIASTIRIAA